MRKPTYKELEKALFSAASERDCWALVWRFPMPDFCATVELGTETDDKPDTETWYLHATHRMSGPVLRIVYGNASESVRYLMNADFRDVYRVGALHACQTFHNNVVSPGLNPKESQP